MKKIKIIALILLTLIFVMAIPAKAAKELPKGITVNPSMAHVDLALDPSELKISYTNNTNSEITLSLSVEDFTELEDGYKISFIEGNKASTYKYSLSSWISFENNLLQLNPGETKAARIFIDNKRITKGGHYASILAKIQQPIEKNTINLQGVLSSLLFVRASTGREIEEGKISDFKPLRDGFDYPDVYILRFENNGNVHIAPFGLIEVYDPLGNLAAKGQLNMDSSDALPESIKRYDTKVITYQKVLLPGIYTAKINMHFGKNYQKLSKTITFFSQGSIDLIKTFGILIIIIIAGIYLRKRVKEKAEKKS
jgi:hypothetical protein